MKLRALRLRVNTESGEFGTDLRFGSGLVLLRADNSSGKSTVVQSVVYALGLEGMLGPSHAVPMPEVMTDRIRDEATGQVHSVLESSVVLEFENNAGDIATVRRFAFHLSNDKNLVTVWPGALLTGKADGPSVDYFARLSGSAQREGGYYTWLSAFLGYELPEVARFSGDPSPLYLETFFPLFVVEQKRGWSGVLAQIPMHLQIRDVAKRAVEFVLALDVSDRALRKQELEIRLAQLREKWSGAYADSVAVAHRVSGIAQGMPSSPPTTWPPIDPPSILVPHDDEWITVEAEMSLSRDELRILVDVEVPTAEEAADGLGSRVVELEAQLQDHLATQSQLDRDRHVDRAELETLVQRSDTLREEQRRLRDAALLQRLGSEDVSRLMPDDCPTCHQQLSEALLAPSRRIDLIAVGEAEVRVREEIRLTEALALDVKTTFRAKELRLAAANVRVNDVRGQLRAAKQALVQASGSPSVAAIEERVNLQRRIKELESAQAEFQKVGDQLGPIVVEWVAAQGELKAIRKELMSETDETKLGLLEALMISQLVEYGFRSVEPSELTISRDKYTPMHEGFDLGFDISASDMIRLIWAYLLGMLEMAREVETNHAGVLVFDEPRQQEAEEASFAALLSRASNAGKADQQILFATSSPKATIEGLLDGKSYTMIHFEGLILKRLGTD